MPALPRKTKYGAYDIGGPVGLKDIFAPMQGTVSDEDVLDFLNPVDAIQSGYENINKTVPVEDYISDGVFDIKGWSDQNKENKLSGLVEYSLGVSGLAPALKAAPKVTNTLLDMATDVPVSGGMKSQLGAVDIDLLDLATTQKANQSLKGVKAGLVNEMADKGWWKDVCHKGACEGLKQRGLKEGDEFVHYASGMGERNINHTVLMDKDGNIVAGAKPLEGTEVIARTSANDVVDTASQLNPNQRKRFSLGDYDPRYVERKTEQDKFRDLVIEKEGRAPQKDTVSLADYEGRPFIISMSDRTQGYGDLVSIGGKEFKPIHQYGGQDYMFRDEGQVWASDYRPASQIFKTAKMLKREYGEDPLYLPWVMSPTGGDHAHMTGETMLRYADANMSKRNKGKLNTQLKKIIPNWKSFDDEESYTAFSNASGLQRKAAKQMMDRNFRDVGGLTWSEARLANVDMDQLNKRVGSLHNVGIVDTTQPIIRQSGHPTYNTGIAGRGLGVLDDDLLATDLLPIQRERYGIPIRADQMPNETRRSFEMGPYYGRITPELLDLLGY